MTVRGARVLVTGAASGMGRSYVLRAVAEEAASVVAWDVDEAGLATLGEESASSRTHLVTRCVDIADASSVRTAAEEVVGVLGGIDIVINNAGVVRGAMFWEHSERDIVTTMGVNAGGPMLVTAAFLPGMIERSDTPGRVVTIASASGLLANPRMSVYAASKAAATNWSRSLRLELKRSGHDHVAVTTVCPSYVDTGMFAGAKGPLLTPVLEPEHVVDRVWRAMLAGEAELMMPWTVRLSSALSGLLPRPAWDALAGRVFGVYSSMDAFTGRD